MDYNSYLAMTDSEREHSRLVTENYKLFHSDPQKARPAIMVRTPFKTAGTIPEYVNDPHLMMLTNLNKIRSHLDVGDDFFPAMRVEFGTALYPSAFGCKVYEREESLPSVCSHVIDDMELVKDMELPALRSGWMSRLYDYTEYFMETMPEGIAMQLPDNQGPFNIAYLLRGNDLLTDFFEYPEEIALLTQRVAEYMIDSINDLNRLQGTTGGWFADFGALWKGSMGIRNCSVHMISTAFYEQFAKHADASLLHGVGGGRIHYCGQHDKGLINSFCSIGQDMTGMDIDGAYHDLWDVSARVPEKTVVFMQCTDAQVQRLIGGDWPQKRNLVIETNAPDAETGRRLYARLLNSFMEHCG